MAKTTKAGLHKKKNSVVWFPDGKISIYNNCIEKNLNNGYDDKIAIHTFSNNYVLKSYTYKDLQHLINIFCLFLKKK